LAEGASADDVYRAAFPQVEPYGLTSQLPRSAASAPANIAEGCGRAGDSEPMRFVRIALGSVNALQYQLILARDIDYLEAPCYAELSDASLGVSSMLANLIRPLQRRPTDDGRRRTEDR
jgi:four helix bundle protein